MPNRMIHEAQRIRAEGSNRERCGKVFFGNGLRGDGIGVVGLRKGVWGGEGGESVGKGEKRGGDGEGCGFGVGKDDGKGIGGVRRGSRTRRRLSSIDREGEGG